MESKGKFYIGRMYDPKKGAIGAERILYDPDDLVTHGVIVGMTGSGKTGLGVDLLEEAALNGIPAIIIDPKGDIANLLLHFPDLLPEQFVPWVDLGGMGRDKRPTEERAAEVAEQWSGGLKEWGIDSARIKAVMKAVQYVVYSPGSDAAMPVSIMASLAAPDLEWEDHKEAIRDRISTTATALLGLVGIEADPIKSREHILVSNILEAFWQEAKDLDLEELIRLIQAPPFKKLGAFDLEQFFPVADRMDLALSLNNLLASPGFQVWREGAPLDVHGFLWTSQGKPKHSVFYMAHLTESERMFFLTLLLSAVETYLHGQSGSSSLKAILYIDEMLGYLPPVASPPSKPPLIRMIKQARAYGFGLLLTTQNPVDLDYKALSNAGTWFIGKLQAERDKARLLEGLESVREGDGTLKRSELDKLISGLEKRVFLLHNVHEKKPLTFHTRWAMAYLAGPITKDRLAELNRMAGAEGKGVTTKADLPAADSDQAIPGLSATRPAVPKGVQEYFLPNNVTPSDAAKSSERSRSEVEVKSLIYRPALLAQAEVRYVDRKHRIDHIETLTSIVQTPDPRGFIHWEDSRSAPVAIASLVNDPEPQARFGELSPPLNDAKILSGLEGDFLDHVFHDGSLILQSNSELDIVSHPGMSAEEFSALCVQEADKACDAEVSKLKAKYESKITAIQRKLAKEQRELVEDEADLSARKLEEAATHAENILGLFSGSRATRRVSSSLSKRRMTTQAKADVDESIAAIEEFEKELGNLQAELQAELDEIDVRWDEVASAVEEITLSPQKTNIRLTLYGIAWHPFWLMAEGEDLLELPAYRG